MKDPWKLLFVVPEKFEDQLKLSWEAAEQSLLDPTFFADLVANGEISKLGIVVSRTDLQISSLVRNTSSTDHKLFVAPLLTTKSPPNHHLQLAAHNLLNADRRDKAASLLEQSLRKSLLTCEVEAEKKQEGLLRAREDVKAFTTFSPLENVRYHIFASSSLTS